MAKSKYMNKPEGKEQQLVMQQSLESESLILAKRGHKLFLPSSTS